MLFWSYLYVSRDASTYECVAICRISKGKSSLIIFDCHANFKYKNGDRHFWCRYVDTLGKYENAIREYIAKQLQEDIMNDQSSLKKFVYWFTSEPVNKAKEKRTR